MEDLELAASVHSCVSSTEEIAAVVSELTSYGAEEYAIPAEALQAIRDTLQANAILIRIFFEQMSVMADTISIVVSQHKNE